MISTATYRRRNSLQPAEKKNCSIEGTPSLNRLLMSKISPLDGERKINEGLKKIESKTKLFCRYEPR